MGICLYVASANKSDSKLSFGKLYGYAPYEMVSSSWDFIYKYLYNDCDDSPEEAYDRLYYCDEPFTVSVSSDVFKDFILAYAVDKNAWIDADFSIDAVSYEKINLDALLSLKIMHTKDDKILEWL